MTLEPLKFRSPQRNTITTEPKIFGRPTLFKNASCGRSHNGDKDNCDEHGQDVHDRPKRPYDLPDIIFVVINLVNAADLKGQKANSAKPIPMVRPEIQPMAPNLAP